MPPEETTLWWSEPQEYTKAAKSVQSKSSPKGKLMKAKITLSLVAVALLLVASTPALAADTVLRVVVVQTDDVDGYVKQLEEGEALLKKMGSPGLLRIWRASFAGPDAGSVVVSIEYESLQALAADMALLTANAEVQTWLKGLDEIRTILSDSIYREL